MMQKKCFVVFVIGAILFNCSNSKNKDREDCNAIIYSFEVDRIKGQTDLSVDWRNQTLLFWIQINKDSLSIPFYIKETDDQLMLKKGKKWICLDSLITFNSLMLDSVYLQKDRIKYYFYLMNKYPLNKISYVAKSNVITIEMDTLSFYNINDSLFFCRDNSMEKLKNGWWVCIR